EYAWREPRFYASVSFNGCVWSLLKNAETTDYKNDVEKQVNYYYGINSDGFSGTGVYLRSGIGIMKYVHPDDTNRKEIKAKAEPAIRFAEILLIYAEALNELEDGSSYNIPSWDGSTSYTVKRDIDEMKKGIRDVRRRAGVPDYTMTEYQDRDVFRTKLKHERQIEFMAEGQRYFDLRRWKDAEVEESKKNYGCNFYMSDTEEQREQFYTPIEIADLPTAFSRKLYFWPISHDELKRNKRLTQNPGWTYND
uniref:RagB/SusD family nutrient uptake outer membrane protein n=2 Tax=Bacteroides TaxID=816 RepID=UPI00319DFD06